MEIVFLTLLFILGACFGSFLCCQARRLHSKPSLGPRSVCLHCHHQLKWYDNLPLLSWLILRGRCRYCHHEIGATELLSELGTATAFLVLGTTINIFTASPLGWAIFVATLIFTLLLTFLAIYDGLYGELPTLILTISIICAIIILTLKEWAILSTSSFTPELVWHPILAVLLLGGLYLTLYLISKGKWVGDGDWLLGTAIALALMNPWLALIALFIANLLACLYAVLSPGPTRQRKIHLGPFLVAAFIITTTFADFFQSVL